MDIKKGILLQLFRGTNKDFDNSGRGKFRSDILIALATLYFDYFVISLLTGCPLDPRAIAVSCYGWLKTSYGWLAG